MLPWVRRVVALAFAAVALAGVAPAHAKAPRPRTRPTATPAEQRFREGQSLMMQHDYVQACPKLEESERLEPRTRTLLLLAECHEHTGKAAAANGEYQEALARARREPKNGAALVRRAERGIHDTQAAATAAATAPPPPTPPPPAPAPTPPPEATQEPVAANAGSDAGAPSPPTESSTEAPAETKEPASTSSEDSGNDDRDPPRHTGLVLGLDSLLLLYEQPPGAAAVAGGPGGGTTLLSVATAGYDLNPALRFYGSFGLARNAPPAGDNGFAFSNPALGARYTFFLGDVLRLALHAGAILPFGSGGGEKADVPVLFATQRARGVYAELFDPNYLTLWLGAEVRARFESLVTSARLDFDESFRTRGATASPDAGKARLHARARVGYVVLRQPQLEPFVELRYQVFVSSPGFLTADPASRDIILGAIGASLRVSPVTLTLSYMRPLDPPLTRDNESMLGFTVGAEL
jgi:hypothetical protein